VSPSVAAAVGGLGGVLAACVLAALVAPGLSRRLLAHMLHRLAHDPYHENLWEAVTGLRRVGVQATLETEMRAATGEPPLRPFGRFRRFPGFDGLFFDPAELARLPAPEDAPVDTHAVLGPRAHRPLRVEIPILVTGMGHAVALSPEAKVALARGAALAGTATNTGMGPFLPAERKAARYLIVQFPRGPWNRDPDVLRQADMVEVQLGQGAWGGSGLPVSRDHLSPELRRVLGMDAGERQVWVPSRMPELAHPSELRDLVAHLRDLTGGVPVGVKLAATDRLEWDLEWVLAAGADAVTLDGCEGGTHGAPPILADDFGLPTLVALCRADRFLRRYAGRDRPTLIVSGGLFTPGDFLKALALGADAVAVGTVALFAAATDQVARAMPWEPPLDLFWYGRPSARRLDVARAAESLARFLRAATAEMALAARALGRSALREVGREDLFALEPWLADLAEVRLGHRPRPPRGHLAAALAGALAEAEGARRRLEALEAAVAGRGRSGGGGL
jgi:glutamate synthase domain-containing protein 2